MADTFTTLWNRLLLRAPSVGAALSQDLVRDSFNQLMERREWSWLMRSGAFYPSIYYATGTISTVPGSNIVTGSGTVFAANFLNCQFRPGAPPSSYPTYTIVQVVSSTIIILDKPWTGPILTASSFQIFQCYFTLPSDFDYFYSIINTTANYRLWHNLTQAELDMADPQRVQTGITYAASFYDYTQNYNGLIQSALQVSGTGPSPVSSTSLGYSYPADSVYSIQITTGGTPGGALVFEWKQDSGTYTTGVSVADNDPIDLSNGVQVFFPQDTYILGDVFIIQCQALTTPTQAKYELWPRPINTPFVYPYLYVAKLAALSDAQPQLPGLLSRRGDVLLEMALSNCARFPGTDTTRNPYYDLQLASQHQQRSETMIYELEKKDDDLAIKDLKYQSLPFYPAPWMDGSWLQRHAIYPNP